MEGVELSHFSKYGGLNKGVTLIFTLTNPFQSCLSVSEWWCVFCLFTLHLSVLFVFHGKNLVLLNLIDRYVTSARQQFLKRKDISEICKVNF